MESNNIMNNETKSTFFSVVVPVYNKEPHISRAIDSILQQSFTNFELIIVCDPSTDNSNQEVENFSDSRIRVLHRDKPGPGGYAARNLGIQEAKSEWIAFLDADDKWYPDHLENIHKSLVENGDYSIISCSWMVYENNTYKLDNYSARGKKTHIINFEDYLLSEINSARPIWTSIACIKKDLLIQAGMFPEGKITMGGDVDTWLRCIELSKEMIWSQHKGAVYYTDSVNMVTRNSIIHPDLHSQTLETILKKDYPKKIEKLLKSRYNNLLTVAWNQNMHMPIESNFTLNGKLFFRPQPIKSAFYLAYSFLPLYLSKPTHSLMYNIIKIKRKLNFYN